MRPRHTSGTLYHVVSIWDGLAERFIVASAEFERRLSAVRPEQWGWPTPCTEWNVRQLVNHMAQANLNYLRLLRGGTRADFLRFRDADALGDDPLGGFARSALACAGAFAEPGALALTLDHPLGPISGRRALAVRTTDSAIHTWDLARAIGADERLDDGLVAWMSEHLGEIYAGMTESPVAPGTTHRFFAAPTGTLAADASLQDRLLHRMGRNPGR